MRLILLLSFLMTGFNASSQTRPDTLAFKDRLAAVSSENFFKTEGYYNWCPSIIKGEDGRFHLFYSRWKKSDGFGGWLTNSEIAHAVADQPAGPWKYLETVLKGHGAGHWDAITAHNPKIEYFDGKYYLYYISTNLDGRSFTGEELLETSRAFYGHPNWKILRKNQRTGVAIAPAINGPWTRLDTTLIEPSDPIATITVNPAVAKGKDGKYYLVVKGDKPGEKKFIRNQALAIADSPTGPFSMQPKPVIDYLDTEDMSIWYDSKRDYFYGIFHSTEGFIGMVSSADGINWQKANEYRLMPKKLKMKNGSVFTPAQMERPFVYVENNEPAVLAVAVKEGDDSFLVFIPVLN